MVVAQEKMMYQEPIDLRSDGQSQRIIKKRKRSSHHGRSILMLAFVVGLTGAVGVETIQLTVVKGAQIRALQTDISSLKEQKDLLQLEADKLRSVSRIESVALSMGMEKPAGTVYMAGTISAVKNQTGTTPPKVTNPQTAEAKPTPLHQFSKLFTSFFASTQR
ncbi:septum formation initiator [Desulfosporosinus sp. FKA]|uniref:septum formation initiator n=1 Tax=Desulfosporosinus sp. FKA TaxID=1969834 RepID=UPI000B49F61F|nr:septum formation initiator [Desulfosporosinus sp. FKA]